MPGAPDLPRAGTADFYRFSTTTLPSRPATARTGLGSGAPVFVTSIRATGGPMIQQTLHPAPPDAATAPPPAGVTAATRYLSAGAYLDRTFGLKGLACTTAASTSAGTCTLSGAR
jgi:hypothetical protein